MFIVHGPGITPDGISTSDLNQALFSDSFHLTDI